MGLLQWQSRMTNTKNVYYTATSAQIHTFQYKSQRHTANLNYGTGAMAPRSVHGTHRRKAGWNINKIDDALVKNSDQDDWPRLRS